MAGIEAESGDVVRDIGDDLPDFVRELDVTAGVRMNDGAYAVAVPRQFGDGEDKAKKLYYVVASALKRAESASQAKAGGALESAGIVGICEQIAA